MATTEDEWLDAALEEHGYYSGDPDADFETLGMIGEMHRTATIPARTTGTGESMRAHEWYKLQGRTTADYLAYLDRRVRRDLHDEMRKVDPKGYDEPWRSRHFALVARSEAEVTRMNLAHPDEIEGGGGRPDARYPGVN